MDAVQKGKIELASLAETRLQRFIRHVGQLEEIFATQQHLVAAQENDGDEHGAEMGRGRLPTMLEAFTMARNERPSESLERQS